MGVLIAFCLLHLGLATTVQVLSRYQFASKDSMYGPATFPLTGNVGSDTKDWYLHAWIYVQSADASICLLGVSSTNNITVYRSGTDFLIGVAGVNSTFTGPQFEFAKWFFYRNRLDRGWALRLNTDQKW